MALKQWKLKADQMVLVCKDGPVRAGFGHNGLSGHDINSVYGCQIHGGDALAGAAK